jgi:hypothetical protein
MTRRPLEHPQHAGCATCQFGHQGDESGCRGTRSSHRNVGSGTVRVDVGAAAPGYRYDGIELLSR